MARHPRRARRRAIPHLVVILVLVLAAVADVAGAELFACKSASVPAPQSAAPPAWAADWTSNANGPLSGPQLSSLAGQDQYVVLEKSSNRWNIAAQFNDARNLVDQARRDGRSVKVFAYYNATYWFAAHAAAWGKYSADFTDNWYLRDASGTPVPHFGRGQSLDAGDDIRSYMTDLSDPQYRAFIVSTVEEWMQSAPFAGLALDSANPLIGSLAQRGIADGHTDFNDLLCGRGAPVASDGNCARVDEWNAGLTDLVQELHSALEQRGDQLMYNGVTDNAVHDGNRNIGLLSDADLASNESFCLQAKDAANPMTPEIKTVSDDIEMLQSTAKAGKKLFEITNYGNADASEYGDYCLGAFLMGWQPGQSFWVYHRDFSLATDGRDPQAPSARVAIGAPIASASDRDGVYSREFEHGVVVVNTTSTAATFSPVQPVAEYSGGRLARTVMPASGVNVPPQTALFMLNASTPQASSTASEASRSAPWFCPR